MRVEPTDLVYVTAALTHETVYGCLTKFLALLDMYGSTVHAIKANAPEIK